MERRRKKKKYEARDLQSLVKSECVACPLGENFRTEKNKNCLLWEERSPILNKEKIAPEIASYSLRQHFPGNAL
jgi:hypothetical protein